MEAEDAVGQPQGGRRQNLGYSDARYARSQQFVEAFRSGLPGMPAAVSSYCRADREDIDWQSWADGGFDFLPQAYVNDLGDYVTPEACTQGAEKWFSAEAVLVLTPAALLLAVFVVGICVSMWRRASPSRIEESVDP